jgi:hypothetical protein
MNTTKLKLITLTQILVQNKGEENEGFVEKPLLVNAEAIVHVERLQINRQGVYIIGSGPSERTVSTITTVVGTKVSVTEDLPDIIAKITQAVATE